MHGLVQGAVDKVVIVNFHWGKKAWQGGAGLNGFGDRYMIPSGAAERGGFATVQVGGHQSELGLELAKVIGPTVAREQASQLDIDLLVGEDAGG